MSKDYYEILGVSKNAVDDEIKRAYRKLAHQYHPDKNKGDDKKFKEINEAYQILGNREKRNQYDRFGRTFSAEGGPASGWEGAKGFGDFGGLSDILEELFGFGRPASRGEGGFGFDFGRGGFGREWSTVQTTLSIDFITAILGGDIEVSVRGPARPNDFGRSGGERIKLKIPAGIQNNEALVHHGKNGDIIFVINIKMPGNLTRKAKELLEELKDEVE
ncbi:MAG: DnaJ domain-containing protein [Candidatus Azambacteria bacterium]|nr:DnaJ domain-containing protein [Candidatus Azambacteria bacterium]